MNRAKSERRGSRTKAAARTSCSSTRRRARPARDGTLGSATGSPRPCATRSPTAACPRAPGCPPRGTLAGQLGCSRGVVVEAYQRLADEGLSAGGAAAGRPCWPRHRRPLPRARPRRPRPACRSTCAPACPTCRPSRARPGCAPNAPRWPARPTPRSATATRAAPSSCAPRSRRGWPGPAGCAPTRRRSWSWAGSPRASRCSRRCSRSAASTTVGYEDPGSRGTRDQLERWGLRARPGPGRRPRPRRRRPRRTASAPCSSPRRTSTRPASSSRRSAARALLDRAAVAARW